MENQRELPMRLVVLIFIIWVIHFEIVLIKKGHGLQSRICMRRNLKYFKVVLIKEKGHVLQVRGET